MQSISSIFSVSGTTARLAKSLAEAAGSDLYEIGSRKIWKLEIIWNLSSKKYR